MALERRLVDAVRAGYRACLLHEPTKWTQERIDEILHRHGVGGDDELWGLQALVAYHVGDLVWLNLEERGRLVHEVCEDMGLPLSMLVRLHMHTEVHRGVAPVAELRSHDHDPASWGEHPDLSVDTVVVPERDPFIQPQRRLPDYMTIGELDALADRVVRAYRAGEHVAYITRRTGLVQGEVTAYLSEAGSPPGKEQTAGLLQWVDLLVIERMTREHLAGESVRVLAQRYRMPVHEVIKEVARATRDVLRHDCGEAAR
ncbi:hypothetical protein [Allokutzneria sp. NRRL B-24872]|uniref:hypothetical protein n=1 Tax=Allokutzneria sp. NRRL B-24872 TaxID=1137961 RepID=UPI000A374AB7|nr:hypothetical protein [Allokutzneria sp. NRRL B-24872]